MLYVSRFSNPELRSGKYTTVRISLGSPKWPLGYKVNGEINDLMPYGLLNIQDPALYEQKYRARLLNIGVDRIWMQLERFEKQGKPVVLLCYEDVRDPSQWCHRSIFAKWWCEQTGEIIEELTDPSQVRLKNQVGTVPARKSTPVAEEAAPAETPKAEQLRMF